MGVVCNVSAVGGAWDADGNGIAGCAHVMGVRHFTLADSTFRNGKGVGLQFGSPDLPRAVEGVYTVIAAGIARCLDQIQN